MQNLKINDINELNIPIDDIGFFYSSLFDFSSPNLLQKKITQISPEILNKNTLAILEAPTGYGKTEAALALAYRYMQICKKNGIYLAMPTRMTSNALYHRANNFLHRIIEDERNFILHHSKSDLFLESIKDEQDSFYQVGGNILTHKLVNLNPFLLGTVDNILTLPFGIKHFPLMHLGLFNHVYIIDEVHSYDTRMFRILCETLKILSLLHVPVILLSATLPEERKKDLVDAYNYINEETEDRFFININLYKENCIESKEVEVTFLQTVNYCICMDDIPDQYYEEDSLEEEYTCFIEEDDPTDIADIKEIANVIQSYNSKGFYGIIVNTVQRAQVLYDHLKNIFGEDSCLLLHSRFDASQRSLLEEETLNIFGKKGFKNRKGLKILVATQIVEQSIDIDFDCLFTDLCPMDSLIQRVGRLHRHSQNDKNRPIKLRKPRVYILQAYNSDKDELRFYFNRKSAFIYSPFILYSTRLVLMEKLKDKNTIDFTRDTPYLVNAIFKCKDKDLFGFSLKDVYNKWKNKENICKKEATQKFFYSPDFDSYEDINLYENGSNTYREAKTKSDAKVRDIVPTLEVCIFYKDYEGVYHTVYDNSVVKVSDYSELMRHTVSLPQGVTRKILKNSDCLEYKTVNNLKIPFLIFEDILSDGSTSPVIIEKYSLQYHPDLGLCVFK